jgi:hypothetical protein
MTRFEATKNKAEATGADSAGKLVDEVEESPLLREVKDLLSAVKGDVDSAAKFEKRLLELKLKLDAAVDALEWPALVAEAIGLIKYGALRQRKPMASPGWLARLKTFIKNLYALLQSKDS